MKKTSRSRHSTLNELNITPLLDLAFVLLVIFIITTPQLVNNLEMFLPSGKPPPADPNAPKPKVNRIEVDDRGQVFLNDEVLTLDALRQNLKQMKSADPELGIVVKASDNTDYQYVVGVLDIIQQMDITKVGFVTQSPTPL